MLCTNQTNFINKMCFFCHQVIEEAKYLKSTAAQRSQEVDALRSELDEAIIVEGQQKAALDDQNHLAVTTICTADRTRQSAAQLAYDEEQQLISVRYVVFLWLCNTCFKSMFFRQGFV